MMLHSKDTCRGKTNIFYEKSAQTIDSFKLLSSKSEKIKKEYAEKVVENAQKE